MNDSLIIALEATWELDPVRLENKLWGRLEKETKKSNVSRTENKERPVYAALKTSRFDS